MALRGKMVSLTASDGHEFKAYETQPADGTPIKGGLVLVQEIFGVTDHIKELSDSFAEEGYRVLSPALYDRITPDYEAGYTPEEVQDAIEMRAKNPYDNAVLDVQASVDALQGAGPVFVTGFCYGGSVSWVAAGRVTGLTASAPYYGGQIKDFIDLAPQVPTICHFGEKDASIPMEVVEQVRSMHPGVTIHVYDADHGFQSDRPAHYDEAAAALARQRTVAFFDEAAAAAK